jgi:hypothetical protein
MLDPFLAPSLPLINHPKTWEEKVGARACLDVTSPFGMRHYVLRRYIIISVAWIRTAMG